IRESRMFAPAEWRWPVRSPTSPGRPGPTAVMINCPMRRSLDGREHADFGELSRAATIGEDSTLRGPVWKPVPETSGWRLLARGRASAGYRVPGRSTGAEVG